MQLWILIWGKFFILDISLGYPSSILDYYHQLKLNKPYLNIFVISHKLQKLLCLNIMGRSLGKD